MSGIEIAAAILLIIASALLIILVLMQDSKSGGMGALMGGSDGDSSYFGKNRGRTLDAILSRWTKIVSIAFFVLVVGVNIVLMLLK
ncbi:MAG: preprotein translocase subunit SecG [Acetanaerobacterium sp.]